MSKNTNLSFLTDYITADITNGRIGINNASPTVAFDVVGATKITGVLTLTSTISNGTYTYTLPSATGTLALTSALSGYLPLTGGTLTGALGGTSASFSSSVSSATKFISSVGNNNIVFESLSATTGFQYIQLLNTTAHTIFGIEGTAAGSLLTGGLAYGSVFTSVGNTALQLGTNQTARLTISAAGNVGIGTTSPSAKLEVQQSTDNYGYGYSLKNIAGNTWQWVHGGDNNLYIGYNTSTKFFISNTGNVGIGTSLPSGIVNGKGLVIYDASYPRLILQNTTTGTSTSAYSGMYLVTSDLYIDNPLSNGNIIYNTNAAERMRITSGGNVLIGLTSSGTNKFAISAAGTVSDLYVTSSGGVGSYSLGTGIVYSNGGVLTSTSPSDSRLKTDIKDISYGLSDILKLKPVSYNWLNDSINQGIQFGFIAQDVQSVMPDAIKEFGDDIKYLGLEKDAIYATLVKAIQELSAEITLLKNK